MLGKFSLTVLAATAFAMTAATPSTANATLCFNCAFIEGGYWCVRDWDNGPTSSPYCHDFGGGLSTPCAMGSPCQQTIALSVATIRPDGLMMRAAGIAQVYEARWTPLRKQSLEGALAGLLPSSKIAQLPGAGQPSGLFGELFANAPNDGAVDSDKCEGYSVARSYDSDEAESLRRGSAIVSI